jgi:hypothetical protein
MANHEHKIDPKRAAECYFCGDVLDIDDAVEAGWIPTWLEWDSNDNDWAEVDQPVCCECIAEQLNWDDEAEGYAYGKKGGLTWLPQP